MQRRLVIILAAAVVGGVFFAGLFIHGRVGGGLLLVTDAILIALARLTWSRVRTQGRPLRIAVITVIAVIAVIKLVAG